jgi:hypothetical protein
MYILPSFSFPRPILSSSQLKVLIRFYYVYPTGNLEFMGPCFEVAP